jgi:hypothetical protein
VAGGVTSVPGVDTEKEGRRELRITKGGILAEGADTVTIAGDAGYGITRVAWWVRLVKWSVVGKRTWARADGCSRVGSFGAGASRDARPGIRRRRGRRLGSFGKVIGEGRAK